MNLIVFLINLFNRDGGFELWMSLLEIPRGAS